MRVGKKEHIQFQTYILNYSNLSEKYFSETQLENLRAALSLSPTKSVCHLKSCRFVCRIPYELFIVPFSKLLGICMVISNLDFFEQLKKPIRFTLLAKQAGHFAHSDVILKGNLEGRGRL